MGAGCLTRFSNWAGLGNSFIKLSLNFLELYDLSSFTLTQYWIDLIFKGLLGTENETLTGEYCSTFAAWSGDGTAVYSLTDERIESAFVADGECPNRSENERVKAAWLS
jgi:hypothetical protein